MSVSLRIDGIMVLTGLAIGAGLYVYNKRELLNKINPASHDNVVYTTVSDNSIQGGHNGYSYDDHLFAFFDLINPANESDAYAEKVWGLE